uniref:Ionotropic glutamate receptor C-terminal domain-containing protein n=1 Tax=Tetranychus urticae TaxID=32264 RepID=T1KNC2_TETUR
MNKNYQFKIGFLTWPPLGVYDPKRKKFDGWTADFLNEELRLYDSINNTPIAVNSPIHGNCDPNGNCTDLLGLIQRGEIDFSEKPYPFATLSGSMDGIAPGPVHSDVSCKIASALPEIGTIREDVLKSLSIFTSDAIVLLTFLYLFLLSIPFLLWFFKSKFLNKSASPPLIWPLICAILRQGSSQLDLLCPVTLRCIWMSITIAIFFIGALYSGSFTTDLASKAPSKKINTLADIARSDRAPYLLQEPLCPNMLNYASPQDKRDIERRISAKVLGQFNFVLIRREKKIEECVFIATPQEIEQVRISYCAIEPNWPMPEWYSSDASFPVYLLFSVFNSNLPPDALKTIYDLHIRLFESNLDTYLQWKWKYQVEKFLDVFRLGCLHKTTIGFKPDLYRFNQLDSENYVQFFTSYLFIIPICILVLLGECLSVWIISIMNNQD